MIRISDHSNPSGSSESTGAPIFSAKNSKTDRWRLEPAAVVHFFFAWKGCARGTICVDPGLTGFLFFAIFFATFITTQAQTKRPMTFEDMMHMKRLGGTAVSPDGKWLGYSVTTVDLEKNTKTPELWVQAIAGGEPVKVAVAQPGDDGIGVRSGWEACAVCERARGRGTSLDCGLRCCEWSYEQCEEADDDFDGGG